MKPNPPIDKLSAQYQNIASEIHSDKSPVGIDAKHTHVLILSYLQEILNRLDRLEKMAAKENQ